MVYLVLGVCTWCLSRRVRPVAVVVLCASVRTVVHSSVRPSRRVRRVRPVVAVVVLRSSVPSSSADLCPSVPSSVFCPSVPSTSRGTRQMCKVSNNTNGRPRTEDGTDGQRTTDEDWKDDGTDGRTDRGRRRQWDGYDGTSTKYKHQAPSPSTQYKHIHIRVQSFDVLGLV